MAPCRTRIKKTTEKDVVTADVKWKELIAIIIIPNMSARLLLLVKYPERRPNIE